MERPEKLPLGCDALDDLLGGGIEHGVVTNVYGEAGAGKTNFCVQATVRAVRDGATVVFIDTEGGFSAERFLQMHDEPDALDRVVMSQPTTFEEQTEAFRSLPDRVAEHDAGLVVVDSLVSLYRLQRNGDNVQEINTELSRQFSTLSKIARDRSIPVVVTNQIYSRFDSDESELVGRDIPAYWSKALLELEKAGENRRRATLKKHRSRPEGLTADFYITEEALASEPPSGEEMQIF